jgi:hypothetical protein
VLAMAPTTTCLFSVFVLRAAGLNLESKKKKKDAGWIETVC